LAYTFFAKFNVVFRQLAAHGKMATELTQASPKIGAFVRKTLPQQAAPLSS